MNDLLSLSELFSRNIFRIPDYQRGYSWGSLQLEEFWNDILNLLPYRDHYTGMISLKKLDYDYIINNNWIDEKWLIEKRGYNAYHIVDGQQRLTTFIILINEIVEFYRKINVSKSDEEIFINSTPLNRIIEDYLVISKPDSDEVIKTYKFGYEVDNPSYEFFKHKILGDNNVGALNETFYTLNLWNAKVFFGDRLNEIYNAEGLESIENIFVKLTQRLKFNMYYIDNDFNVFVAFETMNNRGKRLSNLELLKNRLIYLSTIFNEDEDNKIVLRKNINNTWKEVYGSLGKNKLKPLSDDDFLQDHWIIYFGYTRSNNITYDKFLLNDYFTQQNITNNYNYKNINYNNEIENDNLELEDVNNDEIIVNDKKEKLTLGIINDYINSMKSLIPYWYYIQNPHDSNLNKEIIAMLDKLNRIQFVYFKPLITVLISKQDISDDKKVLCLEKIERYIFLHFRLVNYLSTYKNSFFWNLAHKFYINEVTIDDVILEVSKIDYLSDNKVANMNGILNNINRWFKNYKGYYSWNSIKYFLYEYELYLMNNEANQKIYPENLFKKDEKDKVSIEHIYPQTDNNFYWLKRFGNYSDLERKYLNGSLGNLLPLSLNINIKLQNYSFDEKKLGKDRTRGYINGSHSEMDVAKYDEWTPQEILDRGLEMIRFMENKYDFIIPSKKERIKILGLDFMINDNDENIDVTIPYYEEKKNNSIQKGFNETMFNDLVSKSSDLRILDIYNIIDEYITKLDSNIEKNTTKNYVSFSNGKVFVEFHFMANSAKLYIMPGEYEDELHKVEKLNVSYNWVNNNKLEIYPDDDMNYVLNIIKQSYEKTLKN